MNAIILTIKIENAENDKRITVAIFKNVLFFMIKGLMMNDS